MDLPPGLSVVGAALIREMWEGGPQSKTSWILISLKLTFDESPTGSFTISCAHEMMRLPVGLSKVGLATVPAGEPCAHLSSHTSGAQDVSISRVPGPTLALTLEVEAPQERRSKSHRSKNELPVVPSPGT